mgnify:CR=1 FL=1
MFDFLRPIPKKRTVKVKNKSGVIFSNVYGINKLIFYIGNLFLLASLCFFVYLYQPLISSWIKYKNIEQKNEIVVTDNITPVATKTTDISPTPTIHFVKEEIEVINSQEFIIDIPKIGAKSNIVADVSPTDKKKYMEILKNNNIAHSNLSALPGNGKGSTTYLFAHSTEQSIQAVRKNSVFYLLGELGENDKILINYHDKKFEYQVYMKKIISAKDVEYLTYSEENREVLILQTCWPIGTNWKRLLVFAQRI